MIEETDSPCCKFRETYIDEITTTIEDATFIESSRSKDGGKGFTRTRKITFVHLIILLTQGLSRSIQRELNSFYQKLQGAEFSIQHVTKSAFTRARAKLSPEAFVKLNRTGIKSFYRNAPYLNWNGFRLLAIDGTTAVLPKHKTTEKEFGIAKYGPYADSPRCLARASVLYDVLNLTVLDAQISGYKTSERELALKHFAAIDGPKDIVLFDRGYPGLAQMFEMQALGIDFLIRMRDDWWLEVRAMLKIGETDKEVTFTLPAKDKKLLERYGTKDNKIRCRLVVVELPCGIKEVLCTSVLDKTVMPYESFAGLYHFRWNIEEGYKLFKCRIQLEAFSGKTALAIKQDFFAKIFMMTTAAVFAFPVEEKIKQELKDSSRMHPCKVNRTNALAMVREIAYKVFIEGIILPALNAFDKILRATTEIVRPNRTYPRKKTKKKPPSMNYKHL